MKENDMNKTLEQLYAPAVRMSVKITVEAMREQTEQLNDDIRFIQDRRNDTGGAIVINSIVASELENAQTNINMLQGCLDRLKEELTACYTEKERKEE